MPRERSIQPLKKPKTIEEPRLGVLDPSKSTTLFEMVVDKEVERFLNKASKLSNHTVSSVIAVILATQLIQAKEVIKSKKKGAKKY